MVITDIKKTKQGRYALFLDGEFAFSIHGDSYRLTNISPGLVLDRERLEELYQEDLRRSCKDKALRLLAHASHSRGMLLDKLERDYPPQLAEETADRMAQLGLLDDLDYGRRFGADCIRLRGWSLRRTRQELQRRRLDRDTVDQVMEYLEQGDEDGDGPRILKLLEGRYRQKLADPAKRPNVIAALMRQGFALGDIRDAMARLGDQDGQEDWE